MTTKRFNFDIDTSFYEEDGMLCMKGAGYGDRLFHTGFGYIVYKESIFKDGILRCLKTFSRYPGGISNDFSRDQLTSALVSLKINKDPELYALRIPRRISDKFRVTSDMMNWIRAIQGDKKAGQKFLRQSKVVLKVSLWWNKKLYRACGLKPVPPHSITNYRSLTKKEKIATTLHYPAYALHLFAWQLYVIEDCEKKHEIQSICLNYIMEIDSSNYLLRLLFGGYVSINEIYYYIHMTGIRWQCIFIKDQYNMVKLAANEEENQLDKDLLNFIYQRSR